MKRQNDIRFLLEKVALVTGGGSGQGRAIALALADAGAAVAIGSFVAQNVDRSLGEATYYPGFDELELVKEEIEARGARSFAAHLDVCSVNSVNAFHREAASFLGDVDILVNAAGITVEQPVCEHSEDLWLRVIDTNLNGAFRMTRACLPGMIDRKWGRIINIASTAASVGWKGNPAYCASKSGLLGLTRCVGLEGAPYRVTCNAISPTWVNTNLMRSDVEQLAKQQGATRTADKVIAGIIDDNPQKRIIEPEETAALVVFLCTDRAHGITSENISVSGGALW